MKKPYKKVIIDTNLWIHFLISKDFSAFDHLLNEEVVLVFSKELLEEFLEVAQRPKFQRFFSLQSVYDLLEIIQRKAIFVEIISEVAVCRDYKDNFLLSLAKDAKADFILTGDNDLLVLNPFEETSIITINTFLSIYG